MQSPSHLAKRLPLDLALLYRRRPLRQVSIRRTALDWSAHEGFREGERPGAGLGGCSGLLEAGLLRPVRDLELDIGVLVVVLAQSFSGYQTQHPVLGEESHQDRFFIRLALLQDYLATKLNYICHAGHD